MRFLLLAGLIAAVGATAVELDERPAELGEWGYRPEDGALPEVNPPGFTWRPAENAAFYRLQVAISPDFEGDTYQWETPWPAHCPDVLLPPGTYFWRYAAGESADLSAWSKVRSFTIAPEARPNPRPATAYLVRRMPREHPRLFLCPEDLPELRGRAFASEGLPAQKWADLKERAEALLEAPPDISEPPLYPEGVERPSEEWKRIWWGNRLRTIAAADGAATLAFAFRLSGDERYGAGARDLLLALCAWDPAGATAYEYNDEAAMPALYLASRAYDWAYPCLGEADRARVVEMMRARGAQCFEHLRRHQFLWCPYASHRNRAWHFLGEVAIAFWGEIPEAEAWLDYATTVQYTVYPVWGDADGGWHEGTAYWASYLQRFTYWADVIRAAFGMDICERPFFRRTGYYGLYLLPPGAQTGGFGDQAANMTSERIAGLMANFAVGARNPHWQWYAEQHGVGLGSGYLGFLRAARAEGLAAQPPADLPTSIVFRGVGIGVLNTTLLDSATNVQVVFKSSPFGRVSHGYNANNAFLLNLRGQPVFVRSGRRDVSGSPHHREWMWQTRSDNAILVNGQGQLPHCPEAAGRITAFATSDALDVIAGETSDAPSGLERWIRRIIFLKPHAILIHDRLVASEPSSFQWLLHAKGAFEIAENTARWQGEPGTVEVHFIEPEKLSINQTDQFDPPPQAWTKWDLGEWHLTAETGDKTRECQFLTLLVIDETPITWRKEGTDTEPTVVLEAVGRSVNVELESDHFRVEAAGFAREFESSMVEPE